VAVKLYSGSFYSALLEAGYADLAGLPLRSIIELSLSIAVIFV